jgi:hypothetical protein
VINITKYTAAAALVATTSLAGLAPVGTPFVGTAAAQYCPTVTSTPCLQAKQNANTRNYQIGYENPYQCDDEIDTAASAWNAAGSRFRAYKDPDFWYGYRVAGTTKYQVTFEPTSHFYNSTALAETPYGRSVASFYIDGRNIPVVDDADIMVNSDKWASGSFDCDSVATSGNKFDMAEIVAHEFGHLVGQNHVNVTTCVTYQYGQYNVSYDGLCTAEKNAAVRLYGAG